MMLPVANQRTLRLSGLPPQLLRKDTHRRVRCERLLDGGLPIDLFLFFLIQSCTLEWMSYSELLWPNHEREKATPSHAKPVAGSCLCHPYTLHVSKSRDPKRYRDAQQRIAWL